MLERLSPSVRVGPVLIDPGDVRLPLVAALGEQQTLTSRDGPLGWRDDAILAATQSAVLPDRAVGAARGLDPRRPLAGTGRGERMSRYEWPAGPRRSRDAVSRRLAWNVTRDGTVGAEDVDAARLLTRMHDAAAGIARAGPVGAAPVSAAELWLPIGPTTTVRAQVEDEPRVAGRVRDFAVSDDGRRVYAASATGGLWYSEDAGSSWEPVGGFAATRDPSTVTPASNTLACGAVHVEFAPAGTVDPHTVDEVWLGTGEPNPLQQPTDFGTSAYYGGVGILHAVGPVDATRAGTFDPWDRQAQPRAGYAGLRAAGVFSFAADPGNPRRLIAATTRGLHVHDPAALGPDPWSAVIDPTWDARLGSPGSANLVFTDVVWVRETRVHQPVAAVGGDPAGGHRPNRALAQRHGRRGSVPGDRPAGRAHRRRRAEGVDARHCRRPQRP